MTARSGEAAVAAAVVIPKLAMESAQAGAKQVLSGGKGTKTIGWWE